MTDQDAINVRRVLADATAAEHEALHVHPQLSRLAAPNLSSEDYTALLKAYHAFYTAIEQARLRKHVFAALTLAPMIDALRQDMVDMGCASLAPTDDVTLDTPQAVLGALYVLHGAGFGGRTLAANLKRSLPDAPQRYFSIGTEKELWRELQSCLELSNGDEHAIARIVESANKTFRAFGHFVSQTCSQAPLETALRWRAASGAA